MNKGRGIMIEKGVEKESNACRSASVLLPPYILWECLF